MFFYVWMELRHRQHFLPLFGYHNLGENLVTQIVVIEVKKKTKGCEFSKMSLKFGVTQKFVAVTKGFLYREFIYVPLCLNVKNPLYYLGFGLGNSSTS